MFWKQIPLLTQFNICANLLLAERKAQDQFLFSYNPPHLCQPALLSVFFSVSLFMFLLPVSLNFLAQVILLNKRFCTKFQQW